MIKRIIFLVQLTFNLRDYNRFGIELLQKNGFQVEVWSLMPILHPDLLESYSLPDLFKYNGLVVINDKLQLHDKLSGLSRSDFVINLLSYNFQALGVYRALSKSLADYAVTCAGAIPNSEFKKNWLDFCKKKVKDLVSLRHPKVWKNLFMKLPLKWIGVKPVSLILAGGERCFNYSFPVDKNTEILQIHTLDYDLYLKGKEEACTEEPVAVFLDAFIPFHPDRCVIGYKSPISADKYYPLLNNFFDLVEKKTGLEVVIAAHPRSNYEDLPDYFKGRKCIRGNTVSLIKKSKLVLNHVSTAVNFAILFYKPVIFMTCSDMDKTYISSLVREFAKWFGKKPIVIDKDNNIDWEQQLSVSRSHYDNYRKAYIKTEDSDDLPFWQVVANRLKKGKRGNMETGRKIVVFERLNLFNLVLAIIYYKIGFDVMYFTIDKKIKGSRYFEKVRKRFSINSIPENHFSFNVERSANEYVFNNIDSIYNSFFAKNRSIDIITAIFKSDLVQSVYKKIVSEKLLSFYRMQLVLNIIVKDAVLPQVYYIPSEVICFINLAKSYPSLYILDKKVKIPKYSFIINLFPFLFEKNAQIFLLAVWPFVLIKNVKKITVSKTPPMAYGTAIRIYKTGFNFKSECRTIDFLLDGEKITKDNTLFCIDTELDNGFRKELARRGYHFTDIPDILKEVNWHLIKRIYFGLLLPAWLKLCIVSIMEPPFIVFSYRSVLGLYLRWSVFLDRYAIKNFVVYNDCSVSHIIRNILLSQRGVKTWYYAHSCHTDDLFVAPHANKDIRSVYFSYLYYDNFVSWGKKSASYYMQHHNNIGNFINIGCLWSEHIKKIAEANDCSKTLNQIHARYKQNITNIKKIIGVFDTTFGKKTSDTPLTPYDMKCFLEGFLRLAEEKDDVIFVLKLKNQLKYIKEDIREILPYYEKMKRNGKFYFLEDLHDPSIVNAVCDLSISACFTSTLNESLGYRKKAIYFDAANNFRGCYYDCFPNLVAHSYDELVRLVDYWLYEVNDEGFSEYIDKYIKDEIDPYADGRAITRFRELLTK